VTRADVSTPVVILKLSGDLLEHGALGAARSLGRLGAPVHVLAKGDWRTLERSRYVAGGDTIAADALGPDVSAALVDYAARFDTQPVLLAIGDAGAFFLDEHAERLSSAYRFPRQPRGLVAALANKAHLPAVCDEHGVPTARWLVPSTLDEARAFAQDVGLPVMAKAADAREIAWSAGEVSVRRIDDLASLEAAVHPNVVLQEYIPGGSDAVWFFHGYFDADATCLLRAVGQKLREYPPFAGMTTLAVCRRNDAVRDAALRLLGAVGYRGIVDAEFRFDASTGRYLALDINPRLGANFRLFAGASGMDVARAYYLDLTGQQVPGYDAPEGRKWWVESYDPTTWRAYFGRDKGRQPWRALPATLRGVREAAWFSPDDLRPFLLMARLSSPGR
jgi:predicted ATP-grasp superfamily ATP-dependent carboligase